MSRKQDVLVLFDFMIELLKEKEEKIIETPIEESETLKQEKPIENKADRILELMHRVDAISKEKASVNHLLATQKKTFEQELQALKESVKENFYKEKKNEEEENDESVPVAHSQVGQVIVTEEPEVTKIKVKNKTIRTKKK